jgi:hypothetical protein
MKAREFLGSTRQKSLSLQSQLRIWQPRQSPQAHRPQKLPPKNQFSTPTVTNPPETVARPPHNVNRPPDNAKNPLYNVNRPNPFPPKASSVALENPGTRLIPARDGEAAKEPTSHPAASAGGMARRQNEDQGATGQPRKGADRKPNPRAAQNSRTRAKCLFYVPYAKTGRTGRIAEKRIFEPLDGCRKYLS